MCGAICLGKTMDLKKKDLQHVLGDFCIRFFSDSKNEGKESVMCAHQFFHLNYFFLPFYWFAGKTVKWIDDATNHAVAKINLPNEEGGTDT